MASYSKKDAEPGSTAEKGVRIAVVDVAGSPPTYRFALLVAPVAGQIPALLPFAIQGGGIVWFSDYLSIADTSRGLRVSDLEPTSQVATQYALGYDAATQT